jgi:hypothetical protein
MKGKIVKSSMFTNVFKVKDLNHFSALLMSCNRGLLNSMVEHGDNKVSFICSSLPMATPWPPYYVYESFGENVLEHYYREFAKELCEDQFVAFFEINDKSSKITLIHPSNESVPITLPVNFQMATIRI